MSRAFGVRPVQPAPEPPSPYEGLEDTPLIIAGTVKVRLSKLSERLGLLPFVLLKCMWIHRDARNRGVQSDDVVAFDTCFSLREMRDMVARVAVSSGLGCVPTTGQIRAAYQLLAALGLVEITSRQKIFPKVTSQQDRPRKRPKRENAFAWRVRRVVYGSWNQDGTGTIPVWAEAGLVKRAELRKSTWTPRTISPAGLLRCAQGGRHSGAVRRAKAKGVPVEEILGAPLPAPSKRVRAAVRTVSGPAHQPVRMVVIEAKNQVEHARREARAAGALAVKLAEINAIGAGLPEARAAAIDPWPVGSTSPVHQVMLAARAALEEIHARSYGTRPDSNVGHLLGVEGRATEILVPAARLLPDDASAFERGVILWNLLDGCLREFKLRRPRGWGRPGCSFDPRVKACRLVADAADALHARQIVPAAWLSFHVGEFAARVKRKEVRVKDLPLYAVLSPAFISRPGGWHARLEGMLKARYLRGEDDFGARVQALRFVLDRNGKRIEQDPGFRGEIERVFFPDGLAAAVETQKIGAMKSSALLRSDAAAGVWVWGHDPFRPGA